MVSVSGIDVKFGRIIAAIVLVIVLIVLYRRHGTGGGEHPVEPQSPSITKAEGQTQEQSQSQLKEVTVKVNDKTCTVTYIQAEVDKPDTNKPKVLLLHGQKYNAEIWREVGTLDKLKESGYEAIAVNLGYKQADEEFHDRLKDCAEDNDARAEFIHQLVIELELAAFVLVSPSKSGEFAIPYIMKSTYNSEMKAFVPIAPLIDPRYTKEQFEKLTNVHVLIVRGEKDQKYGDNSLTFLSKIPGSKDQPIPGADHVCYKEKPDEWHKILLSYLNEL